MRIDRRAFLALPLGLLAGRQEPRAKVGSTLAYDFSDCRIGSAATDSIQIGWSIHGVFTYPAILGPGETCVYA
jgi:hypothetical protein